MMIGLNGVWATVDGKSRPGSDLVKDSAFGRFVASLPNPFAPDPSEFLLPPLPPAEGWAMTALEDPWTVRPITLDGRIPDDAELDQILARFGPEAQDMARISLSHETVQDRRARSRGAKRAGAHYSDDLSAFNLVIEEVKPFKVNPYALGPIGLAIRGSGGAVSKVINKLRKKHTLAGLTFVALGSAEEPEQQQIPGRTLSLKAENEGYEVRIWGTGTLEDVERLLLAMQASLRENDAGLGDPA